MAFPLIPVIFAVALVGGAAAATSTSPAPSKGDDQGPKPRKTVKVRGAKRKTGKHISELPDVPRPEVKDGTFSLQWSRFVMGAREDDKQVYVGDLPPGKWNVDLWVLSPRIQGHVRFPTKPGKKDYGYNDIPPSGAGVTKATLGVLNGLLKAVAPAADAAASAYGVPPGVVTAVVNIVVKVLDLIPGAIERGRVKIWANFRSGRYGDDGERAFMRDQVRRWQDPNVFWAMGQGSLRRRYHWEGSSGELVMLDPPPAKHGKAIAPKGGYELENLPTAKVVPKEGTDYGRLEIYMPPTTLVPGGERRVIITAVPA